MKTRSKNAQENRKTIPQYLRILALLGVLAVAAVFVVFAYSGGEYDSYSTPPPQHMIIYT